MIPGIGTASLDLTALRWEGFKAVIDFEDLDFTGATFAMEVRAYRDAPSALLTLQNASDPDQGISVSVATVSGRTTSTVTIRINKRTLEDLLPYPDSGVKLGPDGPMVGLVYDLHITKGSEYPRHRWLQGAFSIEPGATQNILPANTYTSGATLSYFRTSLAALQSSVPTGQVPVVVFGDSYAEQTILWNAFREAYTDDGFTIAGDGWINVRGLTEPTGVTVSRTGFTLWDASDSTAPTYRTGLDGHYIVRSGTGGTFTVAGTIATRLQLFYDRSQTGKFRWRVTTNGVAGDWTTVTPSGASGVGTVDITGLALGSQTLEVDTSVSTGGNVVILGVYSTRDDPGLVFLKGGNSSLQASDLTKFQDKAGDLFFVIGVKLVIVFLGTNDYQRSDSPPSTFASEMAAFVTNARGLDANISIVYVTPPDTNGTAVNPLTAYDTAMDAQAVTSGIDKFSLRRFMDTWAIESAAGNFTDNEHLNAKGAKRAVNAIKTLLLDAPQ